MNKQEVEFNLIFHKLEALINKLDKVYRTQGLIILDNADMLQIFNISPRTLITWREQKLLTYSKIGSKIFYRVEDVIQFLDNHKSH